MLKWVSRGIILVLAAAFCGALVIGVQDAAFGQKQQGEMIWAEAGDGDQAADDVARMEESTPVERTQTENPGNCGPSASCAALALAEETQDNPPIRVITVRPQWHADDERRESHRPAPFLRPPIAGHA